jgi:hypothetical protein
MNRGQFDLFARLCMGLIVAQTKMDHDEEIYRLESTRSRCLTVVSRSCTR